MATADPAESGAKKRIGDLLVEAGLITKGKLDEALDQQEARGTKIVETLISMGCLTVDDFVSFLSRQPGVASIDLKHYHIPNEITDLIPREMALEHEIFPVDRMGRLLTLAMACPLDSKTISNIQEFTGLRVKPILCHREDIYTAIHTYYPGNEDVVDDWRWDAITERELGPIETAKARSGMKLKRASELIMELSALPALPATVARVQDASQDPSVSPKEVARIIVEDPPIAAKVLSVANSPAYGFTSQIETVDLAVALLGFRETFAIVLSAAVINLFEMNKRFNYGRFWEEALNTAGAARIVGMAAGEKRDGSSFTAGLLHDIGRIALCETVPDAYAKVPSELCGADLIAAEDEVAGINHAEAGYELATHWALPQSLAIPIRFHHRPSDAPTHKKETAIVALAEQWTRDGAINDVEKGEALEAAEPLLDLIGLSGNEAAVTYDNVASMGRAFFQWDEADAPAQTA